jgi:hypothetical protein
MLELDINSAEDFVKRFHKAHWEGWDIVIHNPSHRAWDDVEGRYYNGKWGFQQRISPGADGLWKVYGKNAKHFRTPRS